MKIFIAYSTVGGNTLLVVQKIVEILTKELQDKPVKIKVCLVQQADLEQIRDCDLLILASPTYGQGSLEDNFKPFLKQLTKINLKNKKSAVIGLGDIKYYPHYLTEASIILENFLKQQEAELLLPPLKIGKNPIALLNTLVEKWAKKLAVRLLDLLHNSN